MVNPWDVKLVSQLTEFEMLAYVNHLESTETLTRDADIDSLIERVVGYWRQTRHADGLVPSLAPPFRAKVAASLPARPFHAVIAAPPVGTAAASSWSTYKEISIKVYPWMDEKHVRYIAREQILEQIDADD